MLCEGCTYTALSAPVVPDAARIASISSIGVKTRRVAGGSLQSILSGVHRCGEEALDMLHRLKRHMLIEYIGIGGAMVQLAGKGPGSFVAAKKAENRDARRELPVGKQGNVLAEARNSSGLARVGFKS